MPHVLAPYRAVLHASVLVRVNAQIVCAHMFDTYALNLSQSCVGFVLGWRARPLLGRPALGRLRVLGAVRLSRKRRCL